MSDSQLIQISWQEFLNLTEPYIKQGAKLCKLAGEDEWDIVMISTLDLDIPDVGRAANSGWCYARRKYAWLAYGHPLYLAKKNENN